MSTPVFLVNAFTQRPFRGNPAGVCLPPSSPTGEWMQAVAAEIGAPETAFVSREGGGYHLRWFTPVTEVPLCGHATLAAAHVLFGRGAAGDRLEFSSAGGPLAAVRQGDRIELDFPTQPVEACEPPPGLIEALGVHPSFVGRTPDLGIRRDTNFLCAYADEKVVRELAPDLAALRQLAAGVIVTAAGRGRYDIVSRYFAPAAGIDEDPVTGSAHCALAHYWAPILGRTRLLAWQASSRGGEVEVTLRGARVGLAGHAVTLWAGAWLL